MAARSLAAARRAIALDPDLADAYVARAYISNMTYAPLDSVRADYTEAERLKPSSPNVLTWRASMLMREGRMAEAMTMAERTLQVDPLSPPRRVSVAINALGARRYDLALDQARRAEALESGLSIARALQAWSYLLLGQADRCVALDLGPYQGTRAACLAALGRQAEAAKVADSLAKALANAHARSRLRRGAGRAGAGDLFGMDPAPRGGASLDPRRVRAVAHRTRSPHSSLGPL